MNHLRLSLLKETVVYGGGRMVASAIPLITFPIVARYLAPGEFGQYSALLSLCSWVVILVGFGGAGPLTRYVSLASELEEKTTILSSWLAGMVCITLVTLGITFSLREQIAACVLNDGGLSSLFFLALMAAFSSFLVDLFAQMLRFDLRALLYTVLQVLRGILTAAFSILLLVMGHKLVGLIVGYMSGTLLLLPLYVSFTWKYLRLRCDRSVLKKMLSFGLPLVPATTMWTGLAMIDRLMLLRYASSTDAGLYATAFNLTAPLMVLYSAFGTAWSPRAFQIYKESPQSTPDLYGRALYLLVFGMISVSICLAAIAKDVLTVITPKSYWAAGVIVGMLCVASISDASTYITQIGFSIREKTKYMLIPPMIALGVNVALNYLLIPVWGYIGAAVASALSYAGLSLSYYLIGNRIFAIHVDRRLVWVVICFVFSITVFAYLSNFEESRFFTRMFILLISQGVLFALDPLLLRELKAGVRSWALGRKMRSGSLRG
jgi:O-antigen/teichoic acid export membrane protein